MQNYVLNSMLERTGPGDTVLPIGFYENGIFGFEPKSSAQGMRLIRGVHLIIVKLSHVTDDAPCLFHGSSH